ncbi:MAG: hypothetical protein ACREAC_16920, partial [Blastocatellia bacterium]
LSWGRNCWGRNCRNGWFDLLKLHEENTTSDSRSLTVRSIAIVCRTRVEISLKYFENRVRSILEHDKSSDLRGPSVDAHYRSAGVSVEQTVKESQLFRRIRRCLTQDHRLQPVEEPGRAASGALA